MSILDKDRVKDTQRRKRGFALRNKANTLVQMPAFCHVHVLAPEKKTGMYAPPVMGNENGDGRGNRE